MGLGQKIFATIVPIIGGIGTFVNLAADPLLNLGISDSVQAIVGAGTTVAISVIAEIAVIWGITLPTRTS